MKTISLKDVDSIVERINSTLLRNELYKIQVKLHKTKVETRTLRLEINLNSIVRGCHILEKDLTKNQAYNFLLGFEKGLPILQCPTLQW